MNFPSRHSLNHGATLRTATASRWRQSSSGGTGHVPRGDGIGVLALPARECAHRPRATVIIDSGMGLWDLRGPSLMLNAIARSATLLFFYNLDQLISRVRNRSFLPLGDERPPNPMIVLWRKPHEHLRVLVY